MTKRPSPTWEAEYRHDRRKHRHRCKACQRVIETGERVLMAHRSSRKTVAIHLTCADGRIFTGSSTTWRDNMNAWGLEGLKALGWRVPELDTHY